MLGLLLCATACGASAWPERLAEAVDAGTLATQAEALSLELKPVLLLDETPDERVIDLTAWYRFAAFFSRIELKEELDKKCLAWLVRQPNLSRTVMLAIGPSEQPDKVLNVLRALYRTDRETMEQWPELVAALAVVWDAPAADSVDDPLSRGDWAVGLYHYYTRANPKLRYNLKEMPYQLQTYVVDLVVSEQEVAWVWQRYGKRGDVGGFYFDVPYDYDAYYNGAAQKIADRVYTLENLQKSGGICVDQAYFATQVARALGVPTVTIIGQGGGGEIAHAWVGFLDRRGKQIVWNLRSGRYEEQLYWTGQVNDPQSRKSISESETSLLGELQNAPPMKRKRALALLRSRELFPPEQQAEVLLQSINLCAADSAAWLALADLGAAGSLTNDQSNQVADVVAKFASKQYADLAYQVYLKMISGRSNIEKLDQLEKIVKLFPQRPDIIASIRVEQGKLFKGLKQTDKAIAAWGDVLTNHLYAGPIVLEAIQLTDDTLREEKQGKRLLAIYDRLFKMIPRPTPSAFAAWTPYCRVGIKYAELLDDANDRNGAMRIRQQIAVFDKTVQITSPTK